MIKIGQKKPAAFEYVDADTALHNLSPLPKILILIVVNFITFRFDSFIILLPMAISMLWLLYMAGIPGAGIRRDLTPILFQLVLSLPLALISNGLTLSAVILVARITLRFLVLVSAASLMIRTTAPWKLFRVFKAILGERLAFLALLATRYVPVLSEELTEINQVQALRTGGAESKGIRGLRLRIASLFVPFIQRSVRKAEEIAVAAYARGIVPHE